MEQKKHDLRAVTILLLSIMGLIFQLQSGQTQGYPNTITLDNQSGDFALVQLIGPTQHLVEIPHGQKQTVHVPAGEYELLARYSMNPNQYRYTKGNPFTVNQTASQSSAITITLHKAVGGNYPTYPISKDEFEQVLGKSTIAGFSVVEDPSSGKLLHDAIWDGNIERVKRLIDNGADVNFRDDYDYTPLHWAVREGYMDIVQLLVANGADINAIGMYRWGGKTPLHQAVIYGHKAIEKYLIAHGADVNIRDSSGLRPLDYHSSILRSLSGQTGSISQGAVSQEPIQGDRNYEVIEECICWYRKGEEQPSSCSDPRCKPRHTQ